MSHQIKNNNLNYLIDPTFTNSPSDWKLNFEFELPEDGPNKFGTK